MVIEACTADGCSVDEVSGFRVHGISHAEIWLGDGCVRVELIFRRFFSSGGFQ